MKIGLITCNFGRQKILEICFAGIDRLRSDSKESDIPAVCCGEEDESTMSLCQYYDIDHVYAPNRPLTGKFNTACQEIKKYNPDYICVVGSDNLISTRSFNAILDECEKGIDLIGFNDLYFVGLDDIHSGKVTYFGHTTVLGVGRTVSSKVLDKVNWTPWGIERDRGIDTVMLDTVRDHVKTRSLLGGYHVFDLKTSHNLNPLNFWVKNKGYLPNSNVLWQNIGKNETKLIKEYLER
jgi:hypothetical protein